MKIVVQRVKEAELKVDNVLVAKIDAGLVAFVGFGNEETEAKLDFMVNKICGLRIFDDEFGKMNNGIESFLGEILIIPNFTLLADCSHGYRPNFMNALEPFEAKKMFEKFVNKVQQKIGTRAKSGIFGADMKISQLNNGPVTVIIEN